MFLSAIGLKDLTTKLTNLVYNQDWKTIVDWWNDHDSGVRAWTNLSVTALTVNGVLTTNAAGYIIGTVVQIVQATDTSTTLSSGTAYTSTGLTASITPKSTTHKIKISVTGRANDSALATSNTYVSVFRGASDLSNGSGFSGLDGTINGDIETPVGIVYLDSPAVTTSTTYTVKVKSTLAASATWNASSGTCVILLEEIAQ